VTPALAVEFGMRAPLVAAGGSRRSSALVGDTAEASVSRELT
jgi:hypothetical protein